MPGVVDTTVFAYDASAPVDLREANRIEEDGVVIRDLSFASPVQGRVPAYSYEPLNAEGGPAILIMHGIPGTRSTFRDVAMGYAQVGVTVMTISGPFVRTDLPYREPRLIPSPLLSVYDSVEIVQATIDLRRAVDVLVREMHVDPQRIGYVGHSFGGTLGGLLASVERRIAAFALMVPSSGWATWMRTHRKGHFYRIEFRSLDPAVQERWYASLEPLEVPRWIGGAVGAELLVQIGRQDRVVGPEDTQRFLAALPAGASVRWYDADHALNREAYRDQAAFLGEALGFDARQFEAPLPPGERSR